jgi:hypothetical protein
MELAADRLTGLVADLGFTVVEHDTAIGQISGVPASLSVLSGDPLAIMVRLRLHSDAGEPDIIRRIFEDVPPEAAVVTFEQSCASLSLYDLDELPNEAVRLLLERVADAIAANQLGAPAGCLRCGVAEGSQLMYLEDRPTRLCSACLDGARLEKQHIELDLNRATIGGFFGLPAVFASVAAAWALLWTAIDWLLEFFRIRVIWIDKFTGTLILLSAFGVGRLLGGPLGAALKRSGVVRLSPAFLSLVFVVGAAVCGEIVYVTILMFRFLGVIDVNAALQVFQGVVQQYSTFWVLAKVLLAAATWFFCAARASEKETVRLDV